MGTSAPTALERFLDAVAMAVALPAYSPPRSALERASPRDDRPPAAGPRRHAPSRKCIHAKSESTLHGPMRDAVHGHVPLVIGLYIYGDHFPKI